jgi:predicted phage tail protein
MAETIAIWLLTTFGTANAAGVVVVSMATLQAVTAIVSFVALVGANMAVNKLLAPKMPSYDDPSLASRTQMVRSPIAARQIIYGQTRVSGVIVYLSTTGTKNEYLHIVVAMAGHQVEEIGDVYFNDELALTGPGSGATGRFAGKAEIYKKLGLPDQVAQAQLVARTAGLANGEWTEQHRLRGIAYIYVRLTWDQQVFAGGIPNISALVKGKQVYDPRTATAVYSANPALCLRDYLTDSVYGLGLSASEVDDTAFSVAANICDENVQILPASPVTYEKRYEANGVLYTSASPDENIGKLLSAMGGLVAYSGGKIIPYAAGYRIPTVTLTDSDFAGPLSVQTKTSARDRVNAVKGVFVSEKSEWQPTDFPPATSATLLSQDNGVRYWRDVVLPMTTSSSCAQRLARIELLRGRQEITFTARFRLDAMQVRAGDTVMVTLSKFGWTNKVFEVIDWNFVSDGQPPQLAIEMTMRETASTVYDWNVSDEIVVDTTPTTTLPNPFSLGAPTNLALVADGTTQLIQADGTALPRIKVSWSAPAEEFIQSGGQVIIEYKPGNSTTYLTWSKVGGNQTLDYISSDVRIGTTYDVRLFGQSYFGTSSTYIAASVTVLKDTTPPADPSGLTAFVGTGQAVSLDWIDNAEADFLSYGVYRNTTGITPADIATNKIANAGGSRFVDTEVTIGTTYYYWVNAVDALANYSGFSNRVSAVPTYISGGSVDPTVPATPSAPTFSTETTYISSDGTAFARINILAPVKPTGAVALNILFRMAGASEWMLVSQIDTGSITVSVEGLAPGITYEFAAQGVSSFGYLSAVSSALSRMAPKDTSAPATPTGLAVVVGTGKAVSLDWNDSTEADLSEYGVYRNTTGVTPPNANTNKVAEVRASRFVDTDVVLGTTYYYWVNAYDFLENVSGFSSRVTAVPTFIATADTNQTAPATPNAPTFVSESGYLASDGTTLARINLTAPAMPTGGVLLTILYRRSSASDWQVGNQLTSGSVAVSIDDLTPGQTYEFAARAVSTFEVASAISPTLSRSAPNYTTPPTAPTVAYTTGEYAEPIFQGQVPMYAIGVAITAPTQSDIANVEAKIATTNSPTAPGIAWFPAGNQTQYSFPMTSAQSRVVYFYEVNGTAGGYGFVRVLTRSGIASSWASLGLVTGSPSLIKRPIGTISRYNSDDVTTTGLKTGGGASTRQVNVRFETTDVWTLAGTAATEVITLNISARGFNAKPDAGWIQCSNDVNVIGTYDFDATGNSSSVAYFTLATSDGTNVPSGPHRFSIGVMDYFV